MREMRRKKQALSKEMCEDILRCVSEGMLAMQGEDGYPYVVPVNFAYEAGYIYIHGAVSGYRIDEVLAHPKVTFAVMDRKDVVKEEYTTYFTSVICQGNAALAVSDEDKRKGLWAICNKFMPELQEESHRRIEEGLAHTSIVMIHVENMTGKRASELLDEPSYD